MRMLIKPTRAIHYTAHFLLMLVLARLAVAQQIFPGQAYEAVERAKRAEEHVRDLDLAINRILVRVASPLRLDPVAELRELQNRCLDLKDPQQRAFLEYARSQATGTRLFAVVAESLKNGRIAKRGYMYDLPAGKKWMAFEKIGTSIQIGMASGQMQRIPTGFHEKSVYKLGSATERTAVTALRRDPEVGIVTGIFQGSVFPPSMSDVVPDLTSYDRFVRVDLCLDYIYGTRGGRPVLGRLEYALDSLVDDLYLFLPYDEPTVIWTGPFGIPIEISRARPGLQMFRSNESHISCLTKIRNRVGKPILYNPRDLRLEEVEFVSKNLPRAIPVDMVIVDPRGDEKVFIRHTRYEGKNVLLINSEYWRLLVRGESDRRMGRPLRVVSVPPSKDIGRAIVNGATVALPAGTEIVRGAVGTSHESRIGILLVAKRLPLAKFSGGTATWFTFDPDLVKRIVAGGLVFPVDNDELVLLNFKHDGHIFHQVRVEQIADGPPPIVMLDEDDRVVIVQIASRWEDDSMADRARRFKHASAKMNRRGADSMIYNANTDTFEIVDRGIPPTTLVKFKRPRFRDTPDLLDEASSDETAAMPTSGDPKREDHEQSGEMVRLIKELQTADNTAIILLASRIEKIGSPITPYLVEELRHGSLLGQKNAAWLLAAVPDAKSAIPELRQALKSDDRTLRWNAMYALANVGDPPDDLVQMFLDAATGDSDVRLRELAVENLQSRPASQVVPTLIKALKDPAGKVRHRAGVSLSVFGERALPALQQLIENLESIDPDTREGAAVALKSIGPQARAAASALRRMVKSGEFYEQLVAKRALRAILRD